MSILDELLRAVETSVRQVVREELRAHRPNTPAPEPTTAPVYLSPEDAAELAGVRAATIREWVARGRIPGHRAGRLIRVRLDELERFLANVQPGGVDIVDMEARKRRALARLK